MTAPRLRVAVYVTREAERGRELLVFDDRDHPDELLAELL